MQTFYGDKSNWGMGIVEDINDPLRAGRVRVRVYGLHDVSDAELPYIDLPWSQVMLPVTEAGISGVGTSPTGLVVGSMVYGVFLDGDDKQNFMVLGTVAGTSRQTRVQNQVHVSPQALVGNSNSERIYNFFMSRGYGEDRTSGILGSITAVFDTTEIDPDTTHRNGRYGIGLWTDEDRQNGLRPYVAEQGLAESDLLGQLLYMDQTLSLTGYQDENLEAREPTTPAEAADAFTQSYYRISTNEDREDRHRLSNQAAAAYGNSASADTGAFPERASPEPLSLGSYITSPEQLFAYLSSTTRRVSEVIIHHTDTFENQDTNIYDVDAWHRQRGFSQCGYHFIIRKDGRIQVGRDISIQGAHALAGGHNAASIGISIVGGRVGHSRDNSSARSSDTFTRVQWDALDFFLATYLRAFPNSQILGHYETDPSNRTDPNFDVRAYISSRQSVWNEVAMPSPSQIPETSGVETSSAPASVPSSSSGPTVRPDPVAPRAHDPSVPPTIIDPSENTVPPTTPSSDIADAPTDTVTLGEPKPVAPTPDPFTDPISSVVGVQNPFEFDTSTYLDATQITNLFTTNLANYYSITEINTTLGNYYLKSETYTQAEVNALLTSSDSLGELTDVTLSSPSTAQYLRYNGADWVNATIDYSEIANTPTTLPPAAHTHVLADITDLNSTTDLPEGTNLYYTQARFDTAFAAKDTDDLGEGLTNLYYTQARFDTAFGAKSTTDLGEGTNLYYTTARANADIDARVDVSFVNALNVDAETLDGIDSTSFVRGDNVDNGAVTIRVDDADFILGDATDATTNWLWRDHSVGLLYIGTSSAVPTLRADLNVNSNDILNVNEITNASGGLYLTANDVDFVVRDTTDATTNFIFRDHSLSKLYLGANGSADVQFRSDINTGGYAAYFESTANQIYIRETDAAVGSKQWGLTAQGGVLTLQSRDDSYGFIANLVEFDRSGGMDISGDVIVQGDLTVNGTTTTLNTTELEVEDNIITLNSGVTGVPSLNAGIEVERGTSANVQFRWNESTDKWQGTTDGSNYYDVLFDDGTAAGDAATLDGLDSTQFMRADANDQFRQASGPYIQVTSSSATNPPYFGWHDADGTRRAYLGWDYAGIGTRLNTENGYGFFFTGTEEVAFLNSLGVSIGTATTANSVGKKLYVFNAAGTVAEFQRNDDGDLIEFDGNGYSTFFGMDASRTYLRNNSGARGLALGVNSQNNFIINAGGNDFEWYQNDGTRIARLDTNGFAAGPVSGAINNPNVYLNNSSDLYAQVMFRTGTTTNAKIISQVSSGSMYFDASGGFTWRDSPDGNTIATLSTEYLTLTGTLTATAQSSYRAAVQAKNFDAAGWARIDLQHSSADGVAFLYQTSSGAMYFRNGATTSLPFLWNINGTNVMDMDSTGKLTLNGFTATADATVFTLEPSNYGTGNPALNFKKAATANQWNIDLWDGTANTGIINFNAGTDLRWNNNSIATQTWVTSQGYVTSADGGNADTVDSLHASQFLRSDQNDTLSTSGNTLLTIESTFTNSSTGGLMFKTTGDASKTRITYQKAGVTQGIQFWNNAAIGTDAYWSGTISGKTVYEFGYNASTFYGDLTLSDTTPTLTLTGGVATFKKDANQTFVFDGCSNPGGGEGFWDGLHVAAADIITESATNRFPRTSHYWYYTSTADPTDLQYRITVGNVGAMPAGIRLASANDGNIILNAGAGYVGVNIENPEAPLHVSSTVAPAAIFDAYGTAANTRWRYAGGTSGAPTAPGSGTVIGNFNFVAYDGSTYPVSGATSIRVRTTEAHTTLAKGTKYEFRTIAAGATSATDTLILDPAGSTLYTKLTIDDTSVSGELLSLKGDGSTNGVYHGFFSGDYFIVNKDNERIVFGTNNTTRGEIEAGGALKWNSTGGTIAGATWENGWVKIGTSSAGWSFDDNEMYNAASGVIGTLTGTLQLNAATELDITSDTHITGNVAIGNTVQSNRALYVYKTGSTANDTDEFAAYNYIQVTGTPALTQDRGKYGSYNRAALNDSSTTADSNVAALYGSFGYAQISAGHADNMYGVYGLSSVNGGAGSNGHNVYGGQFESRLDNAGSSATIMHGSMSRLRTTSDADGAVTTGYGVRSFLDHDGTATFGTVYLYQGGVDIEAATGTITTLYGMHLNMRDSFGGTVTNNRGIWVEAGDNETDVRNHIQGSTIFGGNGAGFTNASQTVWIDDNKTSGLGLLVTGGGGGGYLARFRRDVGSTGTIDIHCSSGDPTISFDNGSTGTKDWSIAALSATELAISEDSTPSTDPMLKFISGSGMSLRQGNWLYFQDTGASNLMNIGASGNSMYLQNYVSGGNINMQLAGSNTTGSFLVYDSSGTPLFQIASQYGRQYNYSSGAEATFHDYYYNNDQHANGTTTHASYYSSRSSDGNYEYVGSRQWVGVTNTAGSERSYVRDYIMNNGALLETVRQTYDYTQISTESGYVQVGPQNTSYCHFSTDRSRFYMNKPLEATTSYTLYNTNNVWSAGDLHVENTSGVTEIRAESTGAYRARVSVHGGGTAETSADILLEDDSASTARGMGMYAYNRASGEEWFIGQPYNGDENDFAICHANQLNGNEGGATANISNAELRIDAGDQYLYLGGSKEAIRYGDNWLRLNNSGSFTSGIYCGSSILRTDGQLQVGSSGATFYANSTAVHAGVPIRTTGYVRAGEGSGGVSLTHNDGYGNANVCFNHEAGVPEQAGNCARIEVNTDSTTGAVMNFEIKSNSGTTALSLTSVMDMFETGLRLRDSKALSLGSSSDMEIFHDGTHNYIDLNLGNLYVRDGTTTRFTFDDNGDFTATGNVTANSDTRLKDIQRLAQGTNIIDNLHVYDFLWKDGGKASRGVIAQQVRTFAPWFVCEGEDGILSVDYGKLATAAVYEEKKKREALEEKVEKLEAMVEMLMEKLNGSTE